MLGGTNEDGSEQQLPPGYQHGSANREPNPAANPRASAPISLRDTHTPGGPDDHTRHQQQQQTRRLANNSSSFVSQHESTTTDHTTDREDEAALLNGTGQYGQQTRLQMKKLIGQRGYLPIVEQLLKLLFVLFIVVLVVNYLLQKIDDLEKRNIVQTAKIHELEKKILAKDQKIQAMEMNGITSEDDAMQHGPWMGDLLKSQIVKTNQEQSLIASLFNYQRTFELLYRATRDGFGQREFDHKCNLKGQTLTIIKSTHNKIFGGFTDIKLDMTIRNNDDYEHRQRKSEGNSFLFSIRDHETIRKFKVFKSEYMTGQKEQEQTRPAEIYQGTRTVKDERGYYDVDNLITFNAGFALDANCD